MKYQLLINDIIAQAMAEIDKLSEEELSHKSTPSSWSKKEIMGHLIDSCYNNHGRFIQATNSNNLIFQGYDQDQWVQMNNYQNRNSREILHTWQIANMHITQVISQIPEHKLNEMTLAHNFNQIGMHSIDSKTESSLSYLIWDYIHHMEHHLSQIIANYQLMNTHFI